MKFVKTLGLSGLLIGILMLAGCSLPTKGSDNSTDAVLGVKNIRQLVAEDNKTGRTLMWQVDRKQNMQVEVRVKGNSSPQEFMATDTSFTDGKGKYIQYTARLTNLKPGQSYEYRLKGEGKHGKWHPLNTDNGGAFKALIFPDSQCSDYRVWQKIAADAYQQQKTSSLYINMGDLVDNGADDYQWKEWFKGVSSFCADIPQAPLIGNHETYTLDWKTRLPISYTHLFEVPANGIPEKYKNQFYSFDYGPVHFTVLDSNYMREVKELQPQLKADQLRWAEQDLAQSKAKWKVVLMHRDVLIYSFNPKSGRPKRDTKFIEIGKDYMPLFEKYKVDAVLTAHLHVYRRRVPMRNFQPDPTGVTYILTGVAGNVTYFDLWDDWKNDAAHSPRPETYNYMTMEASDKELTFNAFLPDGKRFDTVTLKK